ncbi:MAG: non-homologous end-joining DNA ligase [Burkholderiaceae bacterium]
MSERNFRDSGHTVALKNLDKLFFPAGGQTKGDLVDYYARVAATALPHYRERAVTMHRFPDGIGGEGFYQQDAPAYYPDWIARARLAKRDGHVDHVLLDDAASLVYIVNQGCITVHTALARYDKPDHPDRMIFDLDPSDDSFEKVRSGARLIKTVLDELALPSFLQTTGSRGLHVVVPLDREEPFDSVRAFARDVAAVVAARDPAGLTVQQRKNKRGDAVFIDTLRNAYGQTAVAPYAVRAIDGAPVATPIRWDELGAATLHPRRYTIGNLFKRLGQTDDPWASMADSASSLAAARRAMARRR